MFSADETKTVLRLLREKPVEFTDADCSRANAVIAYGMANLVEPAKRFFPCLDDDALVLDFQFGLRIMLWRVRFVVAADAKHTGFEHRGIARALQNARCGESYKTPCPTSYLCASPALIDQGSENARRFIGLAENNIPMMFIATAALLREFSHYNHSWSWYRGFPTQEPERVLGVLMSEFPAKPSAKRMTTKRFAINVSVAGILSALLNVPAAK